MIPKTQGLDESVNQAPRRFVEAISATDNASGLIAGVGLIDDDQDDDSEVAAGPLRGIALLSKGIVITVGLIMPLIRWLCAVRVDG